MNESHVCAEKTLRPSMVLLARPWRIFKSTGGNDSFPPIPKTEPKSSKHRTFPCRSLIHQQGLPSPHVQRVPGCGELLWLISSLKLEWLGLRFKVETECGLPCRHPSHSRQATFHPNSEKESSYWPSGFTSDGNETIKNGPIVNYTRPTSTTPTHVGDTLRQVNR